MFAFIRQLKAETGSEGRLYMLNVRWLSEVFWWQLLSAAGDKTELCPFHFVCIEQVLGNINEAERKVALQAYATFQINFPDQYY